MQKSTLLFLALLMLSIVPQVEAANGRIRQIQLISSCPTQTVTSRGQTVRLPATCLGEYSLRITHSGAGSLPHLYKLSWAGGSRGPYPSSSTAYQFSRLSGTATYVVWIDEGQGGESWTITVAGLSTPMAGITVVSPNGGENWTSGTTTTVNWSTYNFSPINTVKIHLDRNYPSGVWETITSATLNDGSFTFMLTGDATSTARLRVMSVLAPIIGDTSNANFTILAPRVTVTAPNGGESWIVGHTYTIAWSSEGLGSDAVNIELQRGYPGGVWETLAAAVPNTASWPWAVYGEPTPSARVRITGASQPTSADTSDASFSITSDGVTPTITVTTPNGSEYWTVGSTQTIVWTASYLNEPVKIEVNRSYPTDDWEIITPATENDGSFAWTVAGSITATARVRISGTVSTEVVDVSDAMFTIAGGSGGGAIAVTSPNGGERWVIGTPCTITWSAPTLNGLVKIEINRQFPTGYWTVIIPSTVNDGSHTWLATPRLTTTARIRISSVTTPSTHDISDGGFTIASTALISAGTQGDVDGFSAVDALVPAEAYLTQNYPNPFNPSTTFEFGVPESGPARLTVYDVTGREVATLLDGPVAAGPHRVHWNCAECPAGVYLVVLSGDGFSVARKATFVK